MSIKERIAAEKKAASDLLAIGEDNLTDEQFEELRSHVAEAKKLEERAELFKDGKAAVDAAAAGAKPAAEQAKSLGELYVKELEAAGMSVLDTKKHPFSTTEFKAATDTQVTGGAEGGFEPLLVTVDQQGAWPYERPLTIADLFSAGTMTGQAIKYPVYGAFEGAAGTVAEGGKKPQMHLPDPTWVTDTLHEVAAFWKVSDTMAEDLPYIVSEIDSHAQYNLKLVEEMQLLAGDGTDPNMQGLYGRDIQTIAQGADTDADRIFKATTLINNATGFVADAVVLNPADYEALRLGKDANSQYYGGGYFSGAYGNGGMSGTPALWGLKTVVTAAIEQGTALVGAFKASGTVYRKGGLRVESTNSNEDDFQNDKVSYRIRERLALQVKYPKGFVKVALGKASSAKASK